MTNEAAPYQPAPVEPAQIDQSQVNPLRRATLWLARALTWLLHAYVLVVEIILLLGFFLLLFGANPSSSFVEWIYRSMDRAMRPFRGIFEPVEIGTASNDVPAVVETSVLFAMIVYAIVLIAVQALLDWLNRRHDRMDREDEAYRQQQRIQQSYASTQLPTQVPPISVPSTSEAATSAPTASAPPSSAPPSSAPPSSAPPSAAPPSAAPPEA